MKLRPAIGWFLAFWRVAGAFALTIERISRRGDSAHNGPVMIGGFLIWVAVVVLVIRSPMVQAGRVGFGANLAKSKGTTLGLLVFSVGGLVESAGPGVVEVGGKILAAGGMVVMSWCFIRAFPVQRDRSGPAEPVATGAPD